MTRYNPCGKVVAMLSSGYETECRFNRDSEETATIRWYRAQPGAETLGYVSAITPLLWLNQPWKRSGVGEVFNAPHKFSGGGPFPRAMGVHVCGDQEDFERGGVYDPTPPLMQYGPDGIPLCCAPLPGGVVVGGSLSMESEGVVVGGSLGSLAGLGGVVVGGAARIGYSCLGLGIPERIRITVIVFGSGSFVVERDPDTDVWAGSGTIENDGIGTMTMWVRLFCDFTLEAFAIEISCDGVTYLAPTPWSHISDDPWTLQVDDIPFPGGTCPGAFAIYIQATDADA